MVSGSSLTNFHGMILRKPVTTNGKVDTGPNTESTILAELKILNTNWWKKEVWSSFKVWPSMMSLMKKSFVYMRKGKVFLSMHASKYYSKTIQYTLLWHLSAQMLRWLKFQLKVDRQLFATSKEEKVDDHPWVGIQVKSEVGSWATLVKVFFLN